MQQHQSYLLHHWHTLDRHDMLGSSMQTLKKCIALGNRRNCVPSVINVMDEFSNKSSNKGMSLASKKGKSGNLDIQFLCRSILKHDSSLAKIEAEQKEKSNLCIIFENLCKDKCCHEI